MMSGARIFWGLLLVVVALLVPAPVLGAAEEVAGQSRPSARSRTLLQLVPDQFLGTGRRPDPDPYLRVLGITDFIAGMTDSYAVSLFKKVRGISLPHA